MIVNLKELKKYIIVFVLMELRDCNKYKKFVMEYLDVVECYWIVGMYSYLIKVVMEFVYIFEDYINLCLEYGKFIILIVFFFLVEYKLFFIESEKF